MNPLSSPKKKVIEHDDVIRLFSNITKVLEVNTRVLSALEQVWSLEQQREGSGKVSQVFRDMVWTLNFES